MPTIDIQPLRGEIPKLDPLKLPNDAAVESRNCRIDSGSLEPLKAVELLPDTLRTGVINGLFHYENSHWFSWNTFVNAIKSPIAQDAYARVYFTGDGVPKVTSNLIATGSDPKPAASYELGVPAPASAITISAVNGTDPDPDDFSNDETRYYTMTYVAEYGEEGPPGPGSLVAEVKDPSQTVDLILPVLGSNPYNVTHKRIYRSATSGSGTDFLFVGEVPLAQTNFTDNVDGDSLGLPLNTYDYSPPPSNMAGLVMGANGIAAGFAGNEACFSEPYLPYAYPTGYRRSTEHDIVAIAATNTSFVFATEGYPYIFSGVSPDAMTEQKLELMQACVSARSMVDMGSTVIYASPDGLVGVGDSGAEVITANLIDKRQWAAFKPETIHAYHYEGKYIAFYGDENGDGSGLGGFVFDPVAQNFLLIDQYATAGFNDILTDTLYLVVDDSGTWKLAAWDNDASSLTYRWRSKIFKVPDTSFSCVKVHTDDPANVGFILWVDGVQQLNLPTINSEIFRLPPIRGNRWQIEVTGTATVQRIALAHSMSEL